MKEFKLGDRVVAWGVQGTVSRLLDAGNPYVIFDQPIYGYAFLPNGAAVIPGEEIVLQHLEIESGVGAK